MAASTFIRLTHFRFGTAYLEYLDTAEREAQALIAEDLEKDASVQMQSTGWLDLHSRHGREVTLCHVDSGGSTPLNSRRFGVLQGP